MSADWWYDAYEAAIEDIADELDIGTYEAEEVLIKRIREDERYLNDYIFEVVEAHQEI